MYIMSKVGVLLCLNGFQCGGVWLQLLVSIAELEELNWFGIMNVVVGQPVCSVTVVTK